MKVHLIIIKQQQEFILLQQNLNRGQRTFPTCLALQYRFLFSSFSSPLIHCYNLFNARVLSNTKRTQSSLHKAQAVSRKILELSQLDRFLSKLVCARTHGSYGRNVE
jgi:hypothetical protein